MQMHGAFFVPKFGITAFARTPCYIGKILAVLLADLIKLSPFFIKNRQ